MEFEFEIYVSDKTNKKMIFITAKDGASGAEYPYETTEDIGEAVINYLNNYYPDIVDNPGEYENF